jgi:hypothetical protein
MEESMEYLKEEVRQKDQELSKKENELEDLRQYKLRNILKQERFDKQAAALVQQHCELQEKQAEQHKQQEQQIKKAKEEKEETALKLKDATDSKDEAAALVQQHRELQEKQAEQHKQQEQQIKKAKEEKEESTLKLKDATDSKELSRNMLVYIGILFYNSKKELDKTKHELSSLKEQVKALEVLKKELVERIDASKNEQANILADSKEELQEKERVVKAQEDLIKSLETSKNEQAKKLEDSKKELEERIRVQALFVGRLEQAKILEDEHAKKELEEAKGELSSSKNTSTEQANMLEGLKKELEEAKRELSSSKNTSTEQANMLEDFEKELEEAKGELSSSKNTSTEQANMLEGLKKKLEGANASLQEATNGVNVSLQEAAKYIEELEAANEESKAVIARQGKVAILNNKRLEHQNSDMTKLKDDLQRVNTKNQTSKVDLNKKLSEYQTLLDKANANEKKLKTAEEKLSEVRTNNVELQTLIDEQKAEMTTRSTTLAYAIKSGMSYPLDTLAKMENFVGSIRKRFEDTSPADDPSSFFPIEQADKSPTDLLQALSNDQDVISLIQSDHVLVSTFYELIQMSFVEELDDADYLDTILSFNSWVSKMIFKNVHNLLTAITKTKAQISQGRKRKSEDTGRSNYSCKQLNDHYNRRKSDNHTSSILPPSNRAAASLPSILPSTKKADKADSTVRVKLTYTAKGKDKAGSIITERIGTPGDKASFKNESILLDELTDDGCWFAYVLKKDGPSKLFCPFCANSYNTKGFTNHSKACSAKKRKKSKKSKEKSAS